MSDRTDTEFTRIIDESTSRIMSDVFNGFGATEYEPIVDRQRFAELFPMPESLGNLLYRGFCGADDRHLIDGSRFRACLEMLIAGNIDNLVKLIFGEKGIFHRHELEKSLVELLEGIYTVTFRQARMRTQSLPKFISNALYDRARQITNDVFSQSSRSSDQITLSELTRFVRNHATMKQVVSLICNNIASIPGFTDRVESAGYRHMLNQILKSEVFAEEDDGRKQWLRCASLLSLPAPNLEAAAPASEQKALADYEESESSWSEDVRSSVSSDISSESGIQNSKSLPVDVDSVASTTDEPSIALNTPGRPGMYKVCQHCTFAIEVRFCVECGAELTRRGIDLSCERCALRGYRLHYNFCARCGRHGLVDRRINLLPPVHVNLASELLLRLRLPKRGVRGYIHGDLQEWFYCYDEHDDRWSASWALLADQFLVLFCRLQIPQPSRIISLQSRTITLDEYHDDHDEFVIDIAPSDDDQDEACKLMTTNAGIGYRWFHQLRLGTRRRAVEDYYTTGESVFELDGLVRRCICRDKLMHDDFLVTSVEKSKFDRDQIHKIRISFALFKLIRHPAIITVKEIFESDTDFTVIVPHLHGGYLMKSLQLKGRFDEAAVRLVVFPVINALIRAHHAGLYMINIRPECLVVTPFCHRLIQIAHLDINKFLSPQEVIARDLPRRLLSYRSPEVLRAGGPTWIWGAPADIWAVGVLMFELLAGELPFEPHCCEFFDYTQALNEKIASNRIWTRVSDEAQHVIRRMLTEDIDQRATADALLDDPWFSIKL